MDRSLRYSLDADILECPICTEPFSLPVYQCVNGHTICSSCCKNMSHQRCPVCSEPIGGIRCLTVEKIMESLLVTCQHAPHGCKELLQYSKTAEREKHEKETCQHKPLPCPHPLCSHEVSRSELPSHLANAHGVQTKRLGSSRHVRVFMKASTHLLMLQDDHFGDGMLLIHREAETQADGFFCSTIHGAAREYTIKVRRRAGPGEGSVYNMQTSAPNILNVVEKSCSPKECLLVPVPADVGDLREYAVSVRGVQWKD